MCHASNEDGVVLTEQETVRVSTRRSEDDDQSDGPLKRKTSEGGVERLVRGKELGEGQDTLSTKLLVDSSLREENSKNIADSLIVVYIQKSKEGVNGLAPVEEH